MHDTRPLEDIINSYAERICLERGELWEGTQRTARGGIVGQIATVFV